MIYGEYCIMVNQYHILLLNGPNINLLGTREPNKYGYTKLSDIIRDLNILSESHGIKLSHFQSNAEYALIECIHQAEGNSNFIIFNPASLTHTSLALRDALLSVNIPFIEIHLSNIYARESFRHHSYLSDIALGVICGFGADGYHIALQIAIKRLSTSH